MMNSPENRTADLVDSIQRESDLLRALEDSIQALLPGGWRAESTWQPRLPGWRPDALLTIVSPSGERSSVLVEARLGMEPREIEDQLSKLEMATVDLPSEAGEPGPPMVVSRFISPRAKQILEAAGANYADATGNLRFSLSRPAMFLLTQGATVNPWRETRDLRSLKGRSAARVVRALCDIGAPIGVRELAEGSGASLGSVSRTLEFLSREALIERDPRKRVIGVSTGDLVLRWAEDFRFTEQNEIVRGFEPRGLDRVLAKLRETEVGYAITGSYAANEIAPLAEARLLVIYGEDVARLEEELGVQRSRTTSNVWLASPPDDLPLTGSSVRDGLRYAAPSQVACDLLDMPGRSPQEAEEILRVTWGGGRDS